LVQSPCFSDRLIAGNARVKYDRKAAFRDKKPISAD
jgi:hypothetical protein